MCNRAKNCKNADTYCGIVETAGDDCFVPAEAPATPPVSPSDSRELLNAINELFKGIDKDECEDPDGWWETDTGAEFGRKKLADLKKLLGI